MPELTVRKAEEKDRPRILELLKQANMHYLGTAEMPELTYENYFVALVGDEIAGFCGFKVLSATEAKTELMVVDQGYRGAGVGLVLQTRRMEEVYFRGIRTLTTNSDLPPTIQWYKKHFGYREIGRLKKVNEFGDPTIDYWTTLQVDLGEWQRKRQPDG